MYKEIYVPVDNSDYSNQACVIGVDVARQFGAGSPGATPTPPRCMTSASVRWRAGSPRSSATRTR